MTTIRITKESRDKLKQYGNTLDESLNKLLDASDEIDQEEATDMTNIRITEDTFNRLMKYKLSPNESHADTVFRLLYIFEKV